MINRHNLKFFSASDDIHLRQAIELYKILSNTQYHSQLLLEQFFGENHLHLDKIIQTFLEKCDVNVSNQCGFTILHYLLAYERVDLALLVIKHPAFHNVNYKSFMDVSALDIAIDLWLRDSRFNLELIETLLQQGAEPTQPTEVIWNGNIINLFLPHILKKDEDRARTLGQLVHLVAILSRYGFLVDDMETHCTDHLFGVKQKCIDIEKEMHLTIDTQKQRIDEFFMIVKAVIAMDQNHHIKSHLCVELTEDRRYKGKSEKVRLNITAH